MTNAKIVLNASLNLMKDGILKGSGVFATMENADGTKETIELPEEIHTFNGWKDRGYVVKKGEKSEIKFAIWKHTTRKQEIDGEEKETESMFMKTAAFFKFSQVEKLAAKA